MASEMPNRGQLATSAAFGEDVSSAQGLSQTFADLSTETIVDILLHLTYLQLVPCRRVCKRLRLIIDDTKSLQYVVELGAAGYERCSSSLNVSDFLDAFRKTQRVYRNPDPKVVRKTLNRLDRPFYDTWAVFYSQFSAEGDIFLFLLEDRRKLCVYSLRSEVADGDRAQILTFTFTIDSHGVDRSQDLLVASSGRSLHFMSLRDGLSHSKAASLQNGGISYPDGLTFESCDICVYGDWLLVNFHHDDRDANTIILYHWPSGELRQTWATHDEGHTLLFAGCFARDHLFMHVQHGTTSTIDVYRLPDACSVQDPIVHIASYEFLECQSSRNRQFVTLKAATAAFGPVFKPTCSMLQLFLDPDVGSSIFIFLDAFEAAFAIELHDKPLRTPMVVPWENWGPKYTCFVDTDGKAVVFGRRVICHDAILDFNPYDIVKDVYGPTILPRHSLRNTHEDDYSGAVLTAGSALPGYVGFPRPHLTTLSYRRTHLNLRIPAKLSWFSVFEEDGVPKIVRIVFAPGRGYPKFLYFVTL